MSASQNKTPLRDMIHDFYKSAWFPIFILVISCVLVIILFISMLNYLEDVKKTREATSPITFYKCMSIKKIFDENVKYDVNLKMCTSKKDDNTVYSYTIVDGKIKREVISL